jgi:predicted nuclease of predicted toxin-antitoxin system
MRFLVDECVGPVVASWLRQEQHDVFSVYEEARGMDDDAILQKAVAENRVLLTLDKDFGEMVFREQQPHQGIVLLRLSNSRAAHRLAVVKKLLQTHSDQLEGHFVVVTETQVRVS